MPAPSLPSQNTNTKVTQHAVAWVAATGGNVVAPRHAMWCNSGGQRLLVESLAHSPFWMVDFGYWIGGNGTPISTQSKIENPKSKML
jgi:hypothetical protein